MTRHHNGQYREDISHDKTVDGEMPSTPRPVEASPADRPAHYGGEANPFEPIKIIEYYDFGFNLGNSVKYICRAGRKNTESFLADLKKARWYIDREIQKLERSIDTKNK